METNQPTGNAGNTHPAGTVIQPTGQMPTQPQPRPTYSPQVVPQAIPTPPAATPVPSPVDTTQNPSHTLKTVVIGFIVLLLFVAVGLLAYSYKMTNDRLRLQSQRLSAAYDTIDKFQGIIDNYEATGKFIASYNNSALSQSLCGGRSLAMSDVYLNDKFAVFRYLCANTSQPIINAAFKKLDNGSYEFTFGAVKDQPNILPGYIYNSDPDFFANTYHTARL